MNLPNRQPKIRTCKEMGHLDPSSCMCGEGIFQRLPTSVTELRCQCEEPEWATFRSIGIPSIGHYCLSCGHPHRYSIVNHHWQCDGCDKYFTIDYRKFPPAQVETNVFGEEVTKTTAEWPPRYLLCEDCDVPVSVSRPRRSRIRFH